MEVGHIVRFSSQKHPFLIEATPCLDLDCSCSIMGLTLTEVDPLGIPPRDQLTFTLRVCLKNWTEHDPPPRSREVESLAHEFMARFPIERIHELGEEFESARAAKKQLHSITLSGTPDELASYSQVIHEAGIREGVTDHSFFFVFEGREFWVEDHYCANPQCDCKQVHVEFWERVHEFFPERCIKIQQSLMVTLSLEGELNETRFSNETASTAKYLLLAWRRRCGDQLREFRRRYPVIKAIGARSFPIQPEVTAQREVPQPKLTAKATAQVNTPQGRAIPSPQRIGRNAPCPCGSGLKFKRCCARRVVTRDL